MSEARAERVGTVGLVPTMGFLHEGHTSLISRSAAECELTMVSLFVNPLQFNESSDLDRYPTDHDRDVGLAEAAGAALVVIPSVEEMYPREPLTRVSVGVIAEGLEGAHRPGHLTGVATVVAKLFAGLQPDQAYFGRKDAQQLAMVRRMAQDLSFPLEVVDCPLIREPDGLALSSRNVFLGSDREHALGLSRGLFAASDAVEDGQRGAAVIEAIVRETSPSVAFDYVTAVDAETMQPVASIDRSVVLAVAATVGSVRLIDNVAFTFSDRGVIADRGSRLSGPSMLSLGQDNKERGWPDVSGD